MSMKITLNIYLDAKVFHIEEVDEVERLAAEMRAHIYSWKTIGASNWLDLGLSVSDVLGLVILPKGLPHYIELGDDEPEAREDGEFGSFSH
jgi:hypothetical protein